jgi:uncharacterized protein (DUF433 family)
MDPTSPQSTNGSADSTGSPASAERIIKTPGTCWGKPRIAGTRIQVEQVVIWHEQMGMSLAEIASRWPHLKNADLEAALAYYHEHRAEIDGDLAEGEKLFKELKAAQPSIQERLRQRI